MTKRIEVLAHVAPTWRPLFADLERALNPIVGRPVRLSAAFERWAAMEPSLAGLTVRLFQGPGAVDEAMARALIRVARSTDPDAESAGWALICQFTPALQSIAKAEARRPGGSDGARATIDTALAELWRQIHQIDLETNRASIFYALAARARRAAVPTVHGLRVRDRLAPILTAPAELSDWGRPACSGPPGPRMRSTGSLSAWGGRDDGTADLHEAEWHIVVEQVTDQLADRLATELMGDLRWPSKPRRSDFREARLRAYLRLRVAAAADGSRPSVTDVAGKTGAAPETVKALQKTIGRAIGAGQDRYRNLVLDAVSSESAAA